MFKINIAFITDDNYCQHAGVMLASLFKNNNNILFNIYCLTFSLELENKEKLLKMCGSKHRISFVEVESQFYLLKNLSVGAEIKKWNPIMYLKCFMHLLLPKTIDRVIFLDIDMIIKHNLRPLYEIDLQENIIGAADDWKYCYLHKKRIGIKQEDAYINSGVLVVDLYAWRLMEEKHKILTFIEQNERKIINDQDVLALYFRNKILIIEQNWNVTTYWFERKPRISDKYLSILDEVRMNPYIIHFCEPIKPWFRECRHPYAYLYKEFLKETPWKNYVFPSCQTFLGKSAWRYVIKQWLNDRNLRYDEWAMVKL